MSPAAHSQDSIEAGAPLAIAVAVHNIPEGLAVAMPVLHATGSRCRAIALGGLSGMAEPLAALLASQVANEASSPSLFGCLFGLTAVRRHLPRRMHAHAMCTCSRLPLSAPPPQRLVGVLLPRACRA